MYVLGKQFYDIFDICREGLKEKPDDELLTNVMNVLREHSKKYAISYTITTGTIKASEITKDIKI